jgi:hypothetical protein
MEKTYTWIAGEVAKQKKAGTVKMMMEMEK